jgi:hypothetical protein
MEIDSGRFSPQKVMARFAVNRGPSEPRQPLKEEVRFMTDETTPTRYFAGCRSSVLVTAMKTILCLAIAATAIQASAAEEITQERAWQLAATYYALYFRIEGVVGQPELHGAYWDAPIHEGAVGSFAGYIHVSRVSGDVSGSGHPVASARSLEAYSKSLHKHSRHAREP